MFLKVILDKEQTRNPSLNRYTYIQVQDTYANCHQLWHFPKFYSCSINTDTLLQQKITDSHWTWSWPNTINQQWPHIISLISTLTLYSEIVSKHTAHVPRHFLPNFCHSVSSILGTTIMSIFKSNDFCGMVLSLLYFTRVMLVLKHSNFKVQETHHGKCENKSQIQKQQSDKMKHLN